MIWTASDGKNAVLGKVVISSAPGRFRGKWFMWNTHQHNKGSQLGKKMKVATRVPII